MVSGIVSERVRKRVITESHKMAAILQLPAAATPFWRDPTRSKQLSIAAILAIHVIVPGVKLPS